MVNVGRLVGIEIARMLKHCNVYLRNSDELQTLNDVLNLVITHFEGNYSVFFRLRELCFN